jgi:hypothetical protein
MYFGAKKPQKPIFRCATNFMLTLNHINCDCGLSCVCEVRDGKQSFFFADDGKALFGLICWEGDVSKESEVKNKSFFFVVNFVNNGIVNLNIA